MKHLRICFGCIENILPSQPYSLKTLSKQAGIFLSLCIYVVLHTTFFICILIFCEHYWPSLEIVQIPAHFLKWHAVRINI